MKMNLNGGSFRQLTLTLAATCMIHTATLSEAGSATTTLNTKTFPQTSQPSRLEPLSLTLTGTASIPSSTTSVHAPVPVEPNEASVTIVQVTSGNVDLPAKLFVPAGTGPYPAVIVMHGVGGLWANDDPQSGIMNPHFEEWGTRFQELGYVALFLDSYSARGIVEFHERRPSAIPEVSDALCSPRHVRPADAYAALDYLRSQAPVGVEWGRVGLMGFSHGAESALASVVDKTVVQAKGNTWKTSYTYPTNVVSLVNNQWVTNTIVATNHNHPAAAPTYPIPNAWGFACVVAYYPGCGFYGYFGSISGQPTANQYMPYAPTLMFHGDADALYSSAPKLVSRSQLHSELLQLPSNPMSHLVYEDAGHSFDEALEGEGADWDARQAAQEATLAFLATWLQD